MASSTPALTLIIFLICLGITFGQNATNTSTTSAVDNISTTVPAQTASSTVTTTPVDVTTSSATVALTGCQMAAPCEPLETSTCLGTPLPYAQTSLVLVNDSSNQTEAQMRLKLWSGLQSVPQCWAVVQPLLCAVYMPPCNGSVIELPSKDMCEKTRGPCRIVETVQGWPEFLKCEGAHFQSQCNSNPVSNLNFNTSSTCQAPLVATSNKDSWYEGVDGCGLQCQNPLFTDDEHRQVHIFIGVVGSLCLVLTLFALLTFIIDWKNANRYPALILFFINACFFVGSIGWLAQFIPGARQDIVCKADGTLRSGEPKIGSGETASCTFIFIFVYFSMMAGVTWFVILAYCWRVTFKSLGTARDLIAGKIAYFHIFAWSFPLVLTIICLAVTEVDGDSLSGICFVGYINHWVRGVFVLMPIGLVVTVGLVFICMGLATLCKLRKESPGVVSNKATAKIMETIFRLGVFAVLSIVFSFITLIVHIYMFTWESTWYEAFKEYTVCKATSELTGDKTQCELTSRPSLAAVQIHIFAYFGAGIAMSSWVWNKATLDAWKRFFRRVFRIADNKPVKLKKHKMIAQAFAKRRDVNNGRMSVSFCSTHDDPLGMKFDLNSVTSADMSSQWVQAMPNLVRRRGGMIHPTAGTLRRYSDSDIQSIASRRLSIDSQVSVQRDKEETKKKKKKRGRKNRIAPVALPPSSRRGSDSQTWVGKGQHQEARRASDTSVITNASAHSIKVSMEKLASSIESLHMMLCATKGEGLGRGRDSFKREGPLGSGGKKGTKKEILGGPRTQPPPVPLATYSLFTASAYVPQTVEMVDLDGSENYELDIEEAVAPPVQQQTPTKQERATPMSAASKRSGRDSGRHSQVPSGHSYPTDVVVHVDSRTDDERDEGLESSS
ncbi:smoothened homolog [Lingula anatina]|uniref:Protein smoothened n=1 Tax=Lingula anatina TaxID=7574 RepID=A0A1S3IJC8_LINAN|nr:smoothened homolog [Lingula anatina]|eukprot:XP_013397991.1 smoothened homolog [Lingula anatina]